MHRPCIHYESQREGEMKSQKLNQLLEHYFANVCCESLQPKKVLTKELIKVDRGKSD